jgi:predicted PurR-regulated permease PerM
VGGLLGVIVAVPMAVMIKEALEVIRQVTPEETKHGMIKPSLPLESESSSEVVSR